MGLDYHMDGVGLLNGWGWTTTWMGLDYQMDGVGLLNGWGWGNDGEPNGCRLNGRNSCLQVVSDEIRLIKPLKTQIRQLSNSMIQNKCHNSKRFIATSLRLIANNRDSLAIYPYPPSEKTRKRSNSAKKRRKRQE